MSISEPRFINKHIVVDSRSVFDPGNTVFAAISTGVGDGNKYIKTLYDKGVTDFIVDRPAEGYGIQAFFKQVPAVTAHLADMAAERLSGFSGGIVITGSIGKTTMKELLYRALLPHCSVRRSPRSWNSGIGLPLAILDMTRTGNSPDHIITEAGIDAPGQGRILGNILGNSHETAIVTPITAEHDDAFESHADKIREKIQIISGCKTIIYADCDPMLTEELNKLAGVRLIPVRQDAHPTIFHALAAEAMRIMGFPADTDSIPLVNKRREIAAGSFGNTIFRDWFTPDLRSLQDALDFMRRQASPLQPTVLFYGNLLDEDEDTEKRIAELAEGYGISISERITPELLADIHRGDRYRNMQILLFGISDSCFESTAEALESAGHRTTLEVDLDALAHNFNHYRSLVPAGTGIIAMVKASAYGMGAIEVGKTLQSIGAAYLAVAVIEEGIALREAGINMPVIVLNPVTNRYPALFAHHLEPAVFSADELRRLIAEAEAAGVKDYPVHIKFDTGMHRVGFTESIIGVLASCYRRLSRHGQLYQPAALHIHGNDRKTQQRSRLSLPAPHSQHRRHDALRQLRTIRNVTSRHRSLRNIALPWTRRRRPAPRGIIPLEYHIAQTLAGRHPRRIRMQRPDHRQGSHHSNCPGRICRRHKPPIRKRGGIVRCQWSGMSYNRQHMHGPVYD